MPTLYIDNQPYVAQKDQNLLAALVALGFDIPYFCWHPALGSVGACRQCAIQQFKDEADTKGRVVMSCMTPVQEGAHFSLEHHECRSFRSSVIEWLMINHPHDCPVCDEGGECHLQDMTVMTRHHHRRFHFKKRTFVNQNLGPFINHEMNRCITCYRCVRYYRDLAGGKDLHAFASSNRVYFGRHEEGALLSEFSGNLVEVCPTGVFTDKAFKQIYTRKWDLQTAPSICQLCSLGCNISAAERYGSIRRVQNRYHEEVNSYFLCDRGRFGHSFVNSKHRLLLPVVRLPNQDDMIPLQDHQVQPHLKEALAPSKRVMGIGSPRACLEANFALRQLVGEENFYDGLSESHSLLLKEVIEIFMKGAASLPSLKDIEEADAIFILGEDVTQTAPLLALAIRKFVYRCMQEDALKQGVLAWQDGAVRNVAQGKKWPVFIAAAHASALDEVASEIYYGAAAEVARFGYAVAHCLNPQKIEQVQGFSKEEISKASVIAAALKQAKRPIVISGFALESLAMIQAAANIAWSLETLERKAGLCYALAEANSMGLGLLQPKPLQDGLALCEQGKIDTVIVLENNLARRISQHQFERFFALSCTVIAIDSFSHATAEKAQLCLPCASFSECTGTLVNQEGRLQRYYSVFKRQDEIPAAFRVLKEIGALRGCPNMTWQTVDEIGADLSAHFPLLSQALADIPSAHFRLHHQKIPRQTQEFSGRTAMNADRSIHEPNLPADPDSPLSYSMEGYLGHPPAKLQPFAWQAGWNSVQAWQKYQISPAGALAERGPEHKIFDEGKESKAIVFYRTCPAKPKLALDEWQVVLRHHIFGSEERAALSLALSQRIPQSYVGICFEDAKRLEIKEGQIVSVILPDREMKLKAMLQENLPCGQVLLPVGLPGMGFIASHLTCQLRVQRQSV